MPEALPHSSRQASCPSAAVIVSCPARRRTLQESQGGIVVHDQDSRPGNVHGRPFAASIECGLDGSAFYSGVKESCMISRTIPQQAFVVNSRRSPRESDREPRFPARPGWARSLGKAGVGKRAEDHEGWTQSVSPGHRRHRRAGRRGGAEQLDTDRIEQAVSARAPLQRRHFSDRAVEYGGGTVQGHAEDGKEGPGPAGESSAKMPSPSSVRR